MEVMPFFILTHTFSYKTINRPFVDLLTNKSINNMDVPVLQWALAPSLGDNCAW